MNDVRNMRLGPNEEGYIENYLISGPKEQNFVDDMIDKNQLHYEKYLRSIIADKNQGFPNAEIEVGKTSRLGLSWNYYFSNRNWFVDASKFYSVLQKIELDAAVNLKVEKPQTVHAVLWSYAATDVWCNEECVCKIDKPVYKPIQNQDMVLNLRTGENTVYISIQNLGVRDTRTLFGIQILDHKDEIEITLPHMDKVLPYIKRDEWLKGIRLKNQTLTFTAPAPEGTTLGYDSGSRDFADIKTRVRTFDIVGQKEVELEAGAANILITCEYNGQKLTRLIEIIKEVKPNYIEGLSYEDNVKRIYSKIADISSVNRENEFAFAMSNILARKALGQEREDDREKILISLQQIEDRYDCSDFLVGALLRYLHNYKVDDELQERIDEVLLNYRYWMDMEGSDAMCFWSENHALLFYSSTMLAGQMYPEAYFVRAKMTGGQLYELGKNKVSQWLDSVNEYGYEEFLSTVYMCVTFAGLLNVIDYGEPEISIRAEKTADNMLRMLCTHTFRGSIIAPMGRVYRGIIYPFRQSAQSFLNMINPNVCDSEADENLAYLATSKYKFPLDLISLMEKEIVTEYSTGNALIRLNKKKYYCMTSVQSPRMDEGFIRWENQTLIPETDSTTHAYTKSLNERFHGTTCFEPGVYGYQQHMWCAALMNDTLVFANHPGGTYDGSTMRPGYWYGNGVMPAVKQVDNKIASIYVIPEEYPIHFTHLFWAETKFDQTEVQDNWVFGRREEGYMAVWCSERLTPYNDQLFDSEYRAYGDAMAYLCICGCLDEHGGFEAFCDCCLNEEPAFDIESYRVFTKAGLELCYERKEDITQYI